VLELPKEIQEVEIDTRPQFISWNYRCSFFWRTSPREQKKNSDVHELSLARNPKLKIKARAH